MMLAMKSTPIRLRNLVKCWKMPLILATTRHVVLVSTMTKRLRLFVSSMFGNKLGIK